MYEYKFKLDRVVDGDTIDIVIDLGFSILHKCRVRLFGIDTPESRTRDLDEKARGKLAKDFLCFCLATSDDHVIKTSVDSKGKFGRVLGEIEVTAGNVCDILVEEGHAYAYFGGNKEEARAKAAELLSESKTAPEKDL